MTTLDQALQQMQAYGLPQLPHGHPITDGKIHRFGPKKKSWYVLHEIRTRAGKYVVVGAFGTWGELDATKVEVDWAGISDEERAELERRTQALRDQEAEKKRRQAELAANRAADQWAKASKSGESPYGVRKQITTPGVRFLEDGTMLVPAVVLGPDSVRLVGLQKIAPDGQKRFNKGMAKAGACCPIGKVEATNRVGFIAEGYATGRSVRMGTDDSLPGFIAFDAGNLLAVARAVRALHPDLHLLFCADDDFQLEQRVHADLKENFGIEDVIQADGSQHDVAGAKGVRYRCTVARKRDPAGIEFLELHIANDSWSRVVKYENAGLAKAHAAAAAVGNASVVSPRFIDRGDNKWTDFNDLHCAEGIGRVKDQLSVAILEALTPASVKAKVAAKARAEAEGAGDDTNVVDIKTKKNKKGAAAKSAAAGEAGNLPPGPEAGQGEPVGDEDVHWEVSLSRNDKGAILPSLVNVFCILDHHEDWEGVIAYDEFSGQVVKLKSPPFAGAELGEWSDMDDLRCTLWMQQKYGFQPRKEVVMDAVLLIADKHKYHVVRTYLESLQWDQTQRLDHWLIDMLGADDTEYNRVVARKWMIAAVARIYKPGCKADNVLILEGTQGLYKSTALKVLGGDWFTDAPFRLGDKEAYIVIRGKWIVELAELDSFNKAESTGAKLFFGQYVDRYRSPYGKRAIDVPRQQVFAGTTNSDAYLKDDTGNRRYWPVKVTDINLEGLKEIRDQLWAEAVARFRAGDEWWPTSDERAMFEEQQDARYVGDAYTSLIREYLVGKAKVTMNDILEHALKLDVAKWTKPEQQRIGRCMSELKWKRDRETTGKREWYYVRPAEEVAAAEEGRSDDPFK